MSHSSSQNGTPVLAPVPLEDQLDVHLYISNGIHSEDAPSHAEVPVPVPVVSSPASGHPTRTVAIIKNHALRHRLDIEPHILEASFEIVKERQMEFDVEGDHEALYELFGRDADSLAEGPVWVYVLQRRRAIEVWNTLMGEEDPERARQHAPNSLRALYGISRKQNGFMGSPDVETAEIQIQSLFASSPPWPISDLPEEHSSHRHDSMRSNSSSLHSGPRRSSEGASGHGRSPASTRASSINGRPNLDGRGSSFRARAVPSTHDVPDIIPRSTKAAELRAMKDQLPKAGGRYAPHVPRVSLSQDRIAKTFANVPGHKRLETIQVASTAAPTIAPRMTKAATLRMGGAVPAAPVAPKPTRTSSAHMFENVPGHKRRETITVASTQVPIVAPRTNRSASLRAQKDHATPPSSFMFKMPSQTTPTLTRSNSSSSLDGMKGGKRPPSATALRPPSVTSTRPASTDPSGKPRVVPRPSSIAPPAVAPRPNKAALLRAKKQEEEAAAKAAAARKAAAKPRPSSMQVRSKIAATF